MQTRFLAQLAHDLRSPLNVVGGALSELALGPHETGQADRTLLFELSQRAIGRLVDLSDRLSLAARLETGLVPALDRCELTALARKVVDGFKPQVRRRIELVFTAPEQPIFVRADAALVTSLLLELLTNANRFARHHVRVTLTADSSICVDDDGPGILEDERAHLFEPFAERRGRSGLGMGLWLARSVALLQGGALAVEPLSPGTRQRVTLQGAQ